VADTENILARKSESDSTREGKEKMSWSYHNWTCRN